ncbi:DUF5666 domain-containing protein [Thermosynechococcaceae cyanobacterium BACA0444]|uniref:DUF5666 domain-containing protein n=1 Tax=Pseudocalidococcus azoricus BACA0444 TaxID=2918990 RepID=A0AAE4FNL4_9CYAN|nr:DUF5666 domain-containing protein [Pseudocalidococcus azoricus]MDS3859280.1 DUF5666 domain-containing protein [Pseudocalidococcus azoricus BACA0444]
MFKFSKVILLGIGLASGLLMVSPVAMADNEVQGLIESVDRHSQSFVVQGINFFVTSVTDYDDGLQSFADLQPGLRVEVKFDYRNSKHYVIEVEREDK